jgi:hypothetical protein
VHTINGGWGSQKFPLAVGHGKTRVRPPAPSTDAPQRSLARPSAWGPR